MPDFSQERNGYSKREVDAYIGRLRGEYVKVCEQRDRMAKRLKEAAALQDEWKATMLSAGGLAKSIEEKARLDAKVIIADAHRQVEEILRASVTARAELRKLYMTLRPMMEDFGVAEGKRGAGDGSAGE
jgi:cell division septum initiation protein DivIVA